MIYHSLGKTKHYVSFKEAVIRGLAPDNSLYFPERIHKIEKIIKNFPSQSIYSIAMEVIKPYIGPDDIPEKILEEIIEDTLCLPFPLVKIHKEIYALELFHGPSMAFKDVGARFMAGCLSYLRKEESKPITVLVATSGDTGGAVAKGFHKIAGVEVVLIFPKGKISLLQEKQLTSVEDNISALEIEGTFDDCQKLVKEAFLDKDLQNKCAITSANSINIARWLPQILYYFIVYKNISPSSEVFFSIPSGNFGNLCAGMLAAKMGLPIKHFIAATNSNDTVNRFLKTGKYAPLPGRETLSNAMDVADPSNFTRIWHLSDRSFSKLKEKLDTYSFTDEETICAIESIFHRNGYMLDPHGALGYLGLQKYFQELKQDSRVIGIFLETAHPLKFTEKIPYDLQKQILIPEHLKKLLKSEKKSIILPNNYPALKEHLLNRGLPM